MTVFVFCTGVYVTGWLKRGPSGIIGTNIPDAKETAVSVIDDKHLLKLSDTSIIENLFKGLSTGNTSS